MTFLSEKPIIYLITKGEATEFNLATTGREILDIVRVAVEEGVSLVQLREKQLSARSLCELTAAVAEITLGSATRLLVNDRADIAVAAGADGVHLATTSLPVEVVRRSFPRSLLVGVSTHSIEEAANASVKGGDFAVFGPVFESPGKRDPTGLAALSDVCSKVGSFPIIGLGGIDETNFESVLAAGASGIAAIQSLNDAALLRSMAEKLR